MCLFESISRIGQAPLQPLSWGRGRESWEAEVSELYVGCALEGCLARKEYSWGLVLQLHLHSTRWRWYFLSKDMRYWWWLWGGLGERSQSFQPLLETPTYEEPFGIEFELQSPWGLGVSNWCRERPRRACLLEPEKGQSGWKMSITAGERYLQVSPCVLWPASLSWSQEVHRQSL